MDECSPGDEPRDIKVWGESISDNLYRLRVNLSSKKIFNQNGKMKQIAVVESSVLLWMVFCISN